MKHLLAAAALFFAALTTHADTPVNVQVASSSWNVAWDNTDWFWYPDNGPDFEAKVYTHTLDGSGHRTYSNYTTKNYGSSSYAWNDAFNTYATKDSLNRSTTVLILARYHYSTITFNNAWADYPDGWPQSFMVFNMWHPPLSEWFTAQIYIPEPNYWCVWAVTQNAYWHTCHAYLLDYGTSGNYPSNVNAYESYGN